MGNEHEKAEGFGTQRLPGTGGDLTPTDLDTEGHRRLGQFDDGGPEDPKQRTSPGVAPFEDGDDVEGHLYTGGPSTQGEFVRRAPGDSPHGD